MYSNERRNGFSIFDLLVKIIFAGLFIFILIWLFNKNVPNMKPFYSNVFRENIKYMQEAGESYFTDDKLPKNLGDEVKITLDEMVNKKLILPFVDEDGNPCNPYSSYVSVVKTENGYELKTNLVCDKESDFTVKVLGCHNYCKDKNCEKKCTIEKITQYQFKKQATKTTTNYSCDAGATLDGKYCYKTVLKDSKSATVKKSETTTYTQPANCVITSGSKEQLKTVVTENKVYVQRIEKTTPGSSRVEQQPYACTTTKKEKEPYDCTKSTTQKSCHTEYKPGPKACNCTNKVDGGRLTTTCEVCPDVPVQRCDYAEKEYTDTCYREVEKTVTSTCYKEVTVTTPATTTYSCPAGTTPEGSGANLKCYKVEKTYSCPAETDVKEGSGANLKCYKSIKGTVDCKCPSDYTLKDRTCYKVEQKESVEKVCPSGYKLEGDKCNLYTTDKTKAKATKKTSKYYVYKWSSSSSLKGYTKTGKTRIVNGKEKCE